jgi:hypothetical protein
MKTILLITCLFLFAFSNTPAQFTIDPANPMIVCDATGNQSDVQSIADGEGGIYIFWYDARTGNNQWDVYGQHYDANGTALWEEDGRELINYEGRINLFSFVRLEDDDFLISFTVNFSTVTTDNGVYVRKIDSDGYEVWDGDVKVFDPTSYPNSMGSAHIVKSADYYYISTSGSVIGGSNTCRINKIDADGNLLWPFNGSNITGMNSFGSYNISSDQSGGLYVYASTGNGSGASLRCMRVLGIDNLSTAWPAWVNVTSGTQGLNYQFSGIGDSQGITFVWEGSSTDGTGGNLYSRRLLASTGLLDWNEATKTICGANGGQGKFYWKKSGNNYHIVWADGRPGVVGNSAIYAQKFTANGIILWQENGVEVANLNTYIPYAEFDLDENNTMCVTHKAGPGFVAHKVSADGVVTWGPAGVTTLSNTYAPFYEDYNVVYSQNKFLVVGSKSAPGGGADNIYMNRIHPAVVQETQSVTACNEYTIHGETYVETGVYTIDYDPDTTLTLTLTIINNVADFDVDGLTLTAVNDGSFQWYRCDLKSPIEGATGPIYTVTESGLYALQLTNGECVDLSECVEIIITSVDEHQLSESITVYPNPASNMLHIDLSKLNEQPESIALYNVFGQMIWQEKNISNQRISIPVEMLANGSYILQITCEDFSIRKQWVKK